MMGVRMMGVFSLIPATVFLTISFFVLVVIKNVASAGLKAFGYVVSALLWVCVALFLSTGLFVMATGMCPMMMMKNKMMCQEKMMGPFGMEDMPGKCRPFEKQMSK